MKTVTPAQLEDVLGRHERWLHGDNSSCRALLMQTLLSGLDLSYRNLSDSNLRNSDLSCSNLTYANLSTSKCAQAIFINTDLQNADMTGISAGYVNFRNANLTCVNFKNAELTCSNFRDAEFTYELSNAASLLNCIMDWDKAPWVTLHRDFRSIKFV